MKKIALLLAASGFLFAGAVCAQSQENITLQYRNGSVMTSNGGEFVTASNGQGLTSGEKLSVSANTSARVVYDRGTADTRDDCVIEFKVQGIYDVPGDCKAGLAWTGSHGGTGWTVAGVAVLAGAMLSDSRRTPVSH